MPLSVAGPLLGAGFGQVLTSLRETVKDVVRNARQFKRILKRLDSTLDLLAQAVEDIERSNQQRGRAVENTQSLIEEMTKGRELVCNSLQIPWWNLVLIVKYSSKLSKLEEDILRFCQVDLQLYGARTVLETREIVSGIRESMDSTRSMETTRVSCAVREPPDFTVGFDMPMKELKTLLLKEEVQLLLLTAPGGRGKTTLVQMLCQDDQIRGTYKENILFVNVSQTPNVKVIVQNLFDYKYFRPEFLIQSDEDAIEQLPQLLNHIGPNPILLILDDVWLGSESLPEKFKFNIPKYKILVTSRTAFPRFEFTYRLDVLNDVDAITLFCHSASLQDGSSYIPTEEDMKKIARGCGGFPLVLKVIGGSLRRQKEEVWRSRLMKWSDGRSFLSSDAELLACLQKSLEFQYDKDNIEDCFMDLGSFPEDQRIPVAALIDMWVELYELDEDGIHAIANLEELTIRNLASLVMAKKDASEVKSYYNESNYNDDFVTQHDILRELAMHQSSREPIGQRSRLIINISKNSPPKWWTEQKQQLINAHLLSISTDELFSSSWCNIQGSEVEVLVLNFHTKNYTLPEFVEKMDKLKVLIVNNYGFFHSKISNFQLLESLSNLKRIRLEKVSISSFCKTLVPLKSLKKISLCMCNIGKAFENCTIQVSDALPNLTEININYCNDLEELPIGLCDIVHLKKLSIANCHKLFALPEEIGKLVNLEVLRLRSCTDLSELPDSIRSLHKLRILDISDCLSIMKLPKHIGEMCSLKELNMKGCLSLRTQFPESIMDLEQLKLVVCDEERAKLWDPIKEFLPDLEVLVAEKDINLNWLPK
ncbi:probable disease resistance protein At5g66900 [Quercus robur]|uniref:probable disease resistance protein At5g66900 n=1 Tax=Quercus robur TaxID=38942 RepID=UPI00216286A2|nr:probable disease resistance protein At5g66900 [Quercus robur]XP_050291611.1 probable disease resistance protein At5g66900 [Quercus robur]XP_050291612.1 probable disease resistance protein At5g66900 [Quercus robur]XP_050291613.1 probable disease resistance protein At5g66900 [Quercus robur]XP_050291614.1 probable disease resistance protein At5g66900 [Quercus robur]XP_050291615.1 probable disease resistance protein At5g66900 [Quercus robur]